MSVNALPRLQRIRFLRRRSLLRGPRFGTLSDRIVVWLDHHDEPAVEIAVNEAGAAVRRQLTSLEKAGAEVYLFRGRTRETLAALAALWGLDFLPPDRPQSSGWVPTTSITKSSRARASLELYSLMGLTRETERLLDQPALDARRRAELLGNIRWSQGRYREASAARKAAGLAPVTQRPVDFWIRGQYIRALMAGLRAVKDADARLGSPSEVALEERLVRAETLARTLQHIRRAPDVRVLATRRLQRFALAHLPDPADLSRAGHPLGTHLAVRVRGAREALGATSEAPADSVEAFGEYEALGAWMNYRHGRLRAEAQQRAVEPQEYRRLQHDHLVLGADGDAARVPFMPGAAIAFTWLDARAALRALDFTPWHRTRVFAWFAAAKCASRIRRARDPRSGGRLASR